MSDIDRIGWAFQLLLHELKAENCKLRIKTFQISTKQKATKATKVVGKKEIKIPISDTIALRCLRFLLLNNMGETSVRHAQLSVGWVATQLTEPQNS